MGRLIAKGPSVDALMQTTLSQRQFIQLTLAGSLAIQAPGHALAQTAGSRVSLGRMPLAPVTPGVETRTLDELHKAAVAEGGQVIGIDLQGGTALRGRQALSQLAAVERGSGGQGVAGACPPGHDGLCGLWAGGRLPYRPPSVPRVDERSRAR